jgi:hypothetical protein
VARAVTAPPAARAAFELALKDESLHARALPDPLPMGRVLRVIDKTVDTENELRVLAGKDEQGYFLDYFSTSNDRDGPTFWHGRIRDDGAVQSLENYEGQWGRRVYRDDPARTEAELQRILTHNERVRAILRAKGFE